MKLLQPSLLCCCLLAALAQPPSGYHPVVVCGPLLGQSLEILNNDKSSWCFTGGEWKWLWGNPAIQTSDALCLLEGLGLAGWDSKENLAVPKPNVQVRPRGGFNTSLSGLQALSSFFGVGILEGGIGNSHLGPRLHAHGYVDGESYIAHAYDWRLGVRDWQVSSFPVLRKLIEDATQLSATPAVLTGISMAGPYLHAFLSWARTKDPAWVTRHVHAWVPVAAPFNGAVMATSAVISSALQTWSTEGDCPNCDPPKPPAILDDKDNLVDEFKSWFAGGAMSVADEVLKRILWKWPSMYLMSTGVDHSTDPPTDPEVVTMLNGEAPPQCSVNPSTGSKCGACQTREGWRFDNTAYLGSSQCAECYKISKFTSCADGYDEALNGWTVSLCCKRHQCEAKTYRASDLPDLLEKVGRSGEAEMMKYALTVGTTADPGVPVHCVFSHNVQTFSKLDFRTHEHVMSDKAGVTLDDGDQTVDAKSAEVCTRWKSTVKVYRVPGVAHAQMLDVAQVIDIIEAVATNNEKQWKDWTEPSIAELRVSGNGTIVPTSALLKVPKGSFEGLFV